MTEWFKGVTFVEPVYLRLLFLPLCLAIGLFLRLVQRRLAIKRSRDRRIVPAKEKFKFAGPYLFWLFVLLSAIAGILAAARPEKVMITRNTESLDLIIALDGSASMRTRDTEPDRWIRSLQFINILSESLAWRSDRVAMVVFALKAWPQIYLTGDPNVVFFFIENLTAGSPFNISNDVAWDTNIQDGLHWAIKLFEKDEKTRGKSKNPKAILVISDGQAWSGDVAETIAKCREKRISIYTIGVGTLKGALIPNSETYKDPAIYSSLDSESLKLISAAGRGEYYELDGQTDADLAKKIITSIQIRQGRSAPQEVRQPLYWYCLLLSAVFVASALVTVNRT